MQTIFIFETPPGQWGFRGDPYLWAELQEELKALPADLASTEFNAILDRAFEDILAREGENRTDDRCVIRKYPQSGMSGGMISLNWWRETGLPLLKQRYLESMPL